MCEFYQNLSCRYFPCHEGIGEACFNCLFCYCPLYAWGSRCGGNFVLTEKGLKDCSACALPHYRDRYIWMMDSIRDMYEGRRLD